MSSELFDLALQNLKKYWGFDAFRPGQDDVVKSILAGNETLVLFPTGGGKSLCYQVPATVLPGLTLVISPLVALMQDQVDQLKSRGVSATFINSTISKKEVEQRIINAANGMYTLLYCAPERLETPMFQHEASNLNIQLVAVDEAHCISEWGHDFRPPYRKIRENIDACVGKTRWMALTATATPKVSEDIKRVLGFSNPTILSKGFERKNLKWWVDVTEQKETRLIQMVKKAPGSGLIYAGTRRLCNDLAATVRAQGIACEAYHAGLPSEDRARIQKQWIDNTLKVVVATNAFGMGIDKPDCRYVIHYDMSYSLEAYYQEAGRAGRDGELSYPTLLIRNSDIKQAKKRVGDSYPDFETLSKTYTALGDALHLAIGSDHPDAEVVSLGSLSTRTGFHSNTVRSALRILSRLGVLEMNELSEPTIGIHFFPGREALVELIESYSNSAKVHFVDQLVRLYLPEATHDYHYLAADMVISKLEITFNGLIKGLEVLKSEGVLDYKSQSDDPLLRLVEPRSNKLPVSRQDAEHFRDIQLDKLEKMIGYAKTRQCRSYYIRSYFGEENVPNRCEMCDRCLASSTQNSTPDSKILSLVMDLIKKNPISLPDLVSQSQQDESMVKVALKWLVQQKKVTYSRKDTLFRAK
jgi:ATP-dependent DNA helicase RecQ